MSWRIIVFVIAAAVVISMVRHTIFAVRDGYVVIGYSAHRSPNRRRVYRADNPRTFYLTAGTNLVVLLGAFGLLAFAIFGS